LQESALLALIVFALTLEGEREGRNTFACVSDYAVGHVRPIWEIACNTIDTFEIKYWNSCNADQMSL